MNPRSAIHGARAVELQRGAARGQHRHLLLRRRPGHLPPESNVGGYLSWHSRPHRHLRAIGALELGQEAHGDSSASRPAATSRMASMLAMAAFAEGRDVEQRVAKDRVTPGNELAGAEYWWLPPQHHQHHDSWRCLSSCRGAQVVDGLESKLSISRHATARRVFLWTTEEAGMSAKRESKANASMRLPRGAQCGCQCRCAGQRHRACRIGDPWVRPAHRRTGYHQRKRRRERVHGRALLRRSGQVLGQIVVNARRAVLGIGHERVPVVASLVKPVRRWQRSRSRPVGRRRGRRGRGRAAFAAAFAAALAAASD